MSERGVPPQPDIQPLLRQAFEALDAHGVRWCLLRLPSSLTSPAGDVDLMIDLDDVPHTADVLQALGFVNPPAAGPTTYLNLDEEREEWVWLDVVSAPRFGAWRLGSRETRRILEDRQRDGILWFPGSDDAFWLLILHLVLDRRRAQAHHRQQLRRALAGVSIGNPLARIVGDLSGVTPAQIVALVERGAWSSLDSLRERSRRPTTVAVRARSRVTALARSALRRAPLPNRWGIGVALLGPDGAGKSTLAAELRGAWMARAHVIYMGTGSRTPSTSGAPRALLLTPLRGPGLDLLGALLTQWWRYLLGLSLRARGRLVIFDRYTEDPFLPAPASQPIWRRLGRRLRRRLACPPPDLTLVLNASGATMHARKGEHSAARIDRERQRYRALAEVLPRTVVVDAEASIEDVRRRALALLWSRQRERYTSDSIAARPSREQSPQLPARNANIPRGGRGH